MLGSNKTIMFDPSLAVAVGLNEAIFLSRVHSWLGTPNSDQTLDDRAIEWGEHFPFWSEPTIRRVMSRLEEQGVLHPVEQGAWSIDYDLIDCLQGASHEQ